MTTTDHVPDRASRPGLRSSRKDSPRVSEDPRSNETLRLALASTVFQGSLYRGRIIQMARDRWHAKAPEFGVDLPLLVTVARALEKRDTLYELALSVMVLIAAVFFLAGSPAITVLAVVAAIIIKFVQASQVRYDLQPLFSKRVFDPDSIRERFPTKPGHDDQFLVEDANVVIHQGFMPFVGAGTPWGAWSFSVDVSRPKSDLGKRSHLDAFGVTDVYEGLVAVLKRLEMDNMTVHDWLFVHGCDVSEAGLLIDRFHRPLQKVGLEAISRYTQTDDPSVRHYKWATFPNGDGETIVSFFLRCALVGTSLFVEVKHYLLPPLKHEHRRVDDDPETTWRNTLEWILGTLVSAPFALAYSVVAIPFKIIHALTIAIGQEDRERRRLIEASGKYNYGAKESFRESLSGDSFERYFQRMTAEMIGKNVARQILDGLVDFLDERGVDTTELKERQTAILNSGIIVQGGDVSAKNLAVGTGAQAVTGGSRLKKAARVATGGH